MDNCNPRSLSGAGSQEGGIDAAMAGVGEDEVDEDDKFSSYLLELIIELRKRRESKK